VTHKHAAPTRPDRRANRAQFELAFRRSIAPFSIRAATLVFCVAVGSISSSVLCTIRPRSKMNDASPNQAHAFSHAPAALRIFRFAADTAPTPPPPETCGRASSALFLI
jgi:hypothetical protein